MFESPAKKLHHSGKYTMDDQYAEYLQKWSLNVADVCRLCVNAKITMKSVTENSQIACIYEEFIGIKV